MMAKTDPELRVHKDWLGLLQPVGLVVSPPALVKAQAVPSQNVAELQQQLVSVVENSPESAFGGENEPTIRDLPAFFRTVLGWSVDDIAGEAGGPPIPDRLELVLPDYNETLRPTYAVVDSMGDGQPLMLVQVVSRGSALDEASEEEGRTVWSASPQAKLERLMREVKVPAGLLCNGDALRLVYAPSGESSGYLTFPVAAMCEVSGRPILAALHMLLSEHRIFSAPDGRRLLDILSESRKYQAEVSNRLSDQVLGALWEFLRGFQSSDPEDGRRIFDQTAQDEPEHVYGGLLTLLMRLIFVLYAEDEGLMPEGHVYANNYSVSGLYDRLRSDAGRYPDTMDQRYGAYAWLLSLFRLVFDGGGHGGLRLPTRHGQLFNPDEFPFLEGRPREVMRVMDEKFEAPRVSDGCIHRVLDALLVLDGERLSYRALDVEQVGSVYEAMMGYEVERALGRCTAVRPKHVVVDVDALLETEGAKRKKWLKDQADCDVTGAAATSLTAATTADEVVAALGRRVSPRSMDAAGTPRLMAPGSLYLQPGEERRRTGSHYTPRELTEPIVRTTLRPVLEALGQRPTAEQILDLKVCDPAMGSGAFLVETCRQLAERLVSAWEIHDSMPKIPADEEPILHARRLVAQRCLYGVDKNPFAVNLAKLSIWLVTLAKDHAFTFVDHAFKHGDSLVGLTKRQIAAFHWNPGNGPTIDFFEQKLKQDIEEALGWRDALQGLDEADYTRKKEAWWEAENALADARLIGDVVVAAFFGADKDKAREELRDKYRTQVEDWRANGVSKRRMEEIVEELRNGETPVPPLHWEIEFPEVFGRENPGFDALVGNPPFLGGTKLEPVFGTCWRAFCVRHVVGAETGVRGAGDLVAYFLNQCHRLARNNGAFGLVTTNSISQGDTRRIGLSRLVGLNASIFAANTSSTWPGMASIEFAQVWIFKGRFTGTRVLDGEATQNITPFLGDSHEEQEPERLVAAADQSFEGVKTQGSGFLISEETAKGLREAEDPIGEVVLPYLAGKDITSRPDSSHSRWAINFWDWPLTGSELAGTSHRCATDYPLCLAIVEAQVRPERLAKPPTSSWNRSLRERWWQYPLWRPALYQAIKGMDNVFARAATSSTHALTRVTTQTIFSNGVIVFAFDDWGAFCVLQSQLHDCWIRKYASSLRNDLRYTPTSCFQTFPFPKNWQTDATLEAAGKSYYEFRADLMVRNNEGLTTTYNRFHNPEERDPDILKLRDLHAAMDRAVLDGYGWTDIPTDCEFLLDYEIDEETWGTKKKPYRLRWPEAVHDEVLARLLDLNQKRYAEEVAAGLHAEKGKKKAALKKNAALKATPQSTDAALPLFGASMEPPEEA